MDREAIYHYESAKKNPGPAIAAEIIGGFFQIFGIGNIIAGNVGGGILLMFSYWVLFTINMCLTSVLIGFFTLPVTWLCFMVLGPALASTSVSNENARLRRRLEAASRG